MNKLIDLGCHGLEGLESLLASGHIDSTYHVYSFEANPYVYVKALDAADSVQTKFASLTVYNCAVCDMDGIVPFNIEKNKTSNACNILETPPDSDVVYGSSFSWTRIPVNSVCAETLLEICDVSSNDSVKVKCDIEGAEFVFLTDLLRCKNLQPIKELYVEWHERFWYPDHEPKVAEKQELIRQLRLHNIVVNEWS
jgi:FkbM family methyltransferase